MHPYTTRRTEAVAALGETKLIAAIRRWLGTASPRAPFGIGDDCAVLPVHAKRQLVTVDPVIYGEHFDSAIAPRDVGEKLLRRNLSDIAAMGGRPTAAVVALALDSRVKLKWLEGFYHGLASASRRFAVPVVGGDISRHQGGIVATLTLLGEPAHERVLTRTGAAIGDLIYATGVLGGSLRSGHHYRFTPRLAEGAWLASRQEVRSMMDLSDGLAKDLQALTPKGAEAALREAAVPRRRGCDLRAALSDGEDYELLFTVSREMRDDVFQKAWQRRFPRTRLSCLGRFVSRGQRPTDAINLTQYHGYEHLR